MLAGDRGLTAAEVAERVEAGAVNEAKRHTSRPLSAILRANFFTPLNAVIGVLAVIAIGFSSLEEGLLEGLKQGLFAGVIIANIADRHHPGAARQAHARQALADEPLQREGPARRRDRLRSTRPRSSATTWCSSSPATGSWSTGPWSTSRNLEIDESLLTGEADPVAKTPGDEVRSGSFAVAGTGLFRAEHIGADSYAAKLVEEASKFTLARSELREGINRFIKLINWLIVPIAMLLIVSQLAGAANWRETIVKTVAGHRADDPRRPGAAHLGRVRRRRHPPRRAQMPRPGAAGHRRPRPHRRAVPRQDRDAHRRRHGRRRDPADQRLRPDPRSPTRSPPWPPPTTAPTRPCRPSPTTCARRRSATRLARHRRRCRSPRRANGAAPASPTTAPGSSARPTSSSTPATPSRLEADMLSAQGLRVLALVTAESASTTGGGSTPPVTGVKAQALVVLRQRLRTTAAATLAYFKEQGVAVKIISGDSPAAVGAVAAQLGVDGAADTVDARRLPEDPEGTRRPARSGPRLRPGEAASEAGVREGAAVPRAHRGDDRRRRQRRARAQGRRPRHRHGIGFGRVALGGAGGAARRRVRHAAARGRRRAAA